MFHRMLAGGLAVLFTVSAAGAVKVACVGDSITEGSGLGDPSRESYPAKLQRVLGTNWMVRNFGVSGRTLLKQGDFPYWKESAYTQSRNYAPDVVIVKLGTNDSKPQNWRHGTNFVADFREFIASYRDLPSRPRVILATPCPVFRTGAFDIRPAVVRDEIAPQVRALAAELGIEVVDFHARLEGHAEWFPDTVHPNSRGTTVMAAILWPVLTRAADDLPPALAITTVGVNRRRLAWPADAGDYVLQTSAQTAGTSNAWTVVETPAVNVETAIGLTNLGSASPRFFRLWRP